MENFYEKKILYIYLKIHRDDFNITKSDPVQLIRAQFTIYSYRDPKPLLANNNNPFRNMKRTGHTRGPGVRPRFPRRSATCSTDSPRHHQARLCHYNNTPANLPNT